MRPSDRARRHPPTSLSTIFGVRSDRIYRFGEGEPAVDILVRDPKGLAALGRLDELAICEAYMAGSLDVVGDMLGFVGLRGVLSDSHPLVYLWRRIAPWLIGRSSINR
jgi:cyclopropane-fatty-acyl-phospholipid synthase